MNFKGKVCWVTGASSGIGEQLCRDLAKQGAFLIMSARNAAVLENLRAQLENAAAHSVVAFDLCDLDDVKQIVNSAWSHKGRVDVLINNGGISQRGLAKDTSIEVDRRIMEVDYFGTIALTKTILPKFIEEKQGIIINISSVAGKLGVSMRSAYSGAKHALIGFMDCLRAEVSEFGIRVVNVCPGFVTTNLSKNALKGDMTPYNKMDDEISNGMPVDVFVAKLLRLLDKGKDEIIIAEGLPKIGYHARRLFPNFFLKLAPKLYKRKD